MHPSNNLLLPILRKHGDRLLKAQIEAMVKELSWEQEQQFLERQLHASVEEIREKLDRSYPDYPFLIEWLPASLKKYSKAWVFAVSGKKNYLTGIDDFTLTLTLFEFAQPLQTSGFCPSTLAETWIDKTHTIRNGYRVKQQLTPRGNSLSRYSGNLFEDMILLVQGKIRIENLEAYVDRDDAVFSQIFRSHL